MIKVGEEKLCELLRDVRTVLGADGALFYEPGPPARLVPTIVQGAGVWWEKEQARLRGCAGA